MNKVRTRFAPSPTGLLHIGGARTALFNWLYAKQHNGEFILRLEDTDTARSSEKFATSIMRDMQWLGLQWHGEVQRQSTRKQRHCEAAKQLLASGAAYKCYCTPEELAAMREQQLARGANAGYDRRWRDSKQTPPPGVKPALRIKMPLEGVSTFTDAIKGKMTVSCAELDDFVILRANDEPTYNMANVVDDMDSGITHVIRGDDHLRNTHRQLQLFAAFNAAPPVFAHMPMIFTDISDPDGNAVYTRMSKRSEGVNIRELRRKGYLPSALINYLARLSWAHGDAEFFPQDFLLKNFSLEAVSHSPARHAPKKLLWLNSQHLRKAPLDEIKKRVEERFDDGAVVSKEAIKLFLSSAQSKDAIELSLPRAETVADLDAQLIFFHTDPGVDGNLLEQHPPPKDAFPALINALDALPEWTGAAIKEAIKTTAKDAGIKFPALAMPMRVLLTGKAESPDIAAIAAILGKEETLARLRAN